MQSCFGRHGTVQVSLLFSFTLCMRKRDLLTSSWRHRPPAERWATCYQCWPGRQLPSAWGESCLQRYKKEKKSTSPHYLHTAFLVIYSRSLKHRFRFMYLLQTLTCSDWNVGPMSVLAPSAHFHHRWSTGRLRVSCTSFYPGSRGRWEPPPLTVKNNQVPVSRQYAQVNE